MLSNYWLLWTGLFLVALFIVSCFTKVKVELYARRNQTYDDVKIKVSLLKGLISFSFRLPKFRINKRGVGFSLIKPNADKEKYELEVDEAMSQYELWIEALEVIRHYRKWWRKLLSKVELSNWNWNSRVGTGEAMSAALSCGALWSIKGLLVGTISRYVKVMNAPQVSIQPLFQQKVFVTEWSCQVQLKLGVLLLAGLYLLSNITMLRKTKHMMRSIISKA